MMSDLESTMRSILGSLIIEPDDITVFDRNKRTLVLAVGDSWTRGASLVDRENEIYGNLVSQYYDADLINLGFSGLSNSYILLNGITLVKAIKESTRYDKIYVLVTLTENGRDVESVVSFDLAKWAYDTNLVFTDDMYQCILDHIEDYWTDQIKEMIALSDDRFSFFIGQNFVWHAMYEKLADISPRLALSDVNWIEVIGDHLGLPRPIRTNLVCGWVFDQVDKINNTQNITVTDKTVYQKYITPFIEKAILVNEWLDTSPMNHKKASKHPNAEAHKLWANHITQRLSTLGS